MKDMKSSPLEDAVREAPAARWDADDIETILDAIARMNLDPAYHKTLADKVAALLVQPEEK